MYDDRIEHQIVVLQKNWELIQDIIKNLGEKSLKLKAWSLTIWWAVISYAFTVKQPILVMYLVFFLIIVFLIDATQRITEEKFLLRSNEIEKGLTALTLGDKSSTLGLIISTNVEIPNLRDFGKLLSMKRFAFWFPYISFEILTLYVYFIVF